MAKKYSGSSDKYNKKNNINRNTYTYSSVQRKSSYNQKPYGNNIRQKNINTGIYSKRPVKKVYKKKPRKNGHRAFMGIMFTILFIYLLGYFIVFLTKPHISVETVSYGTIDVPQVFNGIIIRDEKVFESPIDGQPVYAYSENEKVKINSSVCVIKKDDTTDIIEQKIEEIDKDILENQMKRSDLSIFKEDINRIENTIKETMNLYSYKFSEGSMEEVYSLKNRVDTQINLRNNIWLTENNTSVSELNEQKAGYESQLAESMANVKCDVSGIVNYSVDGMEGTFSYDEPANVTEEQTKMYVDTNQISKSQSVKAGDPLFKIVESNIWYLTAYVPSEAATEWKAGSRKVMITTIGEEEVKINVVINSVEQLEDKAKVVFRSNESLEKIINIRSLDFKIEDEFYEGLKVPNNAIVEKTLLKIPAECIIESNGEKGVLKVSGEETKFVSLIIAKEEEANPETGEEASIYVLQDFQTVKLGDVLIKGTGETAENYTISEVETASGVYVVNSSIADFKVVNIIASNSEYSIIESGSSYGLKVYDNIVSDAKNIQESDSVY